jgi:hypothetical protein
MSFGVIGSVVIDCRLIDWDPVPNICRIFHFVRSPVECLAGSLLDRQLLLSRQKTWDIRNVRAFYQLLSYVVHGEYAAYAQGTMCVPWNKKVFSELILTKSGNETCEAKSVFIDLYCCIRLRQQMALNLISPYSLAVYDEAPCNWSDTGRTRLSNCNASWKLHY